MVSVCVVSVISAGFLGVFFEHDKATSEESLRGCSGGLAGCSWGKTGCQVG